MRNSLADDGVNPIPPTTLLPEPGMTGYAAVVEYGKQNYPQDFSDTVIGQTRVSFGDYACFFKRCFPLANDYPIGIEIDLRPDKRLFAVH